MRWPSSFRYGGLARPGRSLPSLRQCTIRGAFSGGAAMIFRGFLPLPRGEGKGELAHEATPFVPLRDVEQARDAVRDHANVEVSRPAAHLGERALGGVVRLRDVSEIEAPQARSDE